MLFKTGQLILASNRFKDLHLSGTANAPLLITNDIKAAGSGGLALQTDEGTKRLFIKDNGDVKVGLLAVGSAASAPLHVAKSSADVQAIFGDNNSSIDDPSIRIIGRDSSNSAIRYMFAGLDADANHGFIGYNAGAGGFVNALNFDTSGNVGIGTSNPDGALDIEKTVNTAWSSALRANGFLQISNPSTTSGAYSGIELIATSTGSAGAAEIVCIGSGSGSGDLAFSTRNGGTWGEKVRVTSAGNVGIGTSTDSGRLNIYRSGGETQVLKYVLIQIKQEIFILLMVRQVIQVLLRITTLTTLCVLLLMVLARRCASGLQG